MEYKILDINNQEKSRDDLKTNNNKKFEKILKNLLDVKTRGESSLLFKLNNSNFDLFNILEKDKEINIFKIFENSEFSIQIPVKKISQVKSLVNSLETYNELLENMNYLELSKRFVNSFLLDSEVNLNDQEIWHEEIKDAIIKKNKDVIDSFTSKWKRFQKAVNDKYEETNIWPLYIGTYFLKFSIASKEIYAPLILKEISITSNNNNFYIESKNDTVVLNEKLVFFLSEFKKIEVPPIFENVTCSMKELAKELDAFFNESELIDTNNFEIQKLKVEKVETNICKQPGIVMIFCNPLGSALRKATLKLIEFDKLSGDLIKFQNSFFDLSDDKLTKKIIEDKMPLARICKTDLSQEKSIMSALQDSTVIIGPPGTGKSQTIANILANILLENKSALFISQKKVALEVVLERLKFLKFFTFQPIENNSKTNRDEKEKFYENLQQWLRFNFDEVSNFDTNNVEIIPSMSDELDLYWSAKKKDISNEERNFFYKLIELIPTLDDDFFDFIEKYNDQFKLFTKQEIALFETINSIFNTNIEENDLVNIINLKNNLYNLNWIEIKAFLNLADSVQKIDKNLLLFLAENKNKIQNLNWTHIEKHIWMKDKLEIDKNNIVNLLHETKNMFQKLKSIDRFKDIDKLFALSHNNSNKDYFANEFGISKKGFLFFKFYDKEFKNFWSINLDFIKYLSKFKINRYLLSFLCQNENEIDSWIKNNDFILKINHAKVNNDSWNILKNNINNIDIWITSFEVIEIAKTYKLNEEMIRFIKNNLDLIDKLSKNFKSNKEFFKNLSLYNLSIEVIDILDDVVQNINKYKMILDVYNKYHHNYFIPKVNEFVDNEINIKEKIREDIQRIYHSLTPEERRQFMKWKGRIQSGFTLPFKLFSMFKDMFKKFFKIIVSTPESLATKIDFMNERYDYVIFDEASQLFLERAIPFLAISDKAIIAGDNQQMQPSNWFGLRVDSDVSEEEEENDENVESLLTYAINSGIPKHLLELNYRSKYANLTSFSSKHFYESKLKSLDANIDRSKSIEVVQVNGYWENSQNLIEAKKAIEILKDNIDKYEKIIVLTLNKQQIDLIDLILSVEEIEIYNKMINERSIILKNLENIQGDEADLVIVSVAYTRDTHLAGTYVCRPTGKNALNVAITRAKDKMIVIKSIRANEINSLNPNILLFREWLSFLDLHFNQQKTYSIDTTNNFDIQQKIESGFEKSVYEWLSKQQFNKKIKIEAQFSVGSYKIDFALLEVGTEKFLLGIEVDGWKYHSTPRQIYNDTIRHQFIESKGYKLLRIPEMMWEIDKEKILANIHQYID